MDLKQLMIEAHNNAVKKGWWDNTDRNIGELLALMHSEISEALEEWRNNKQLTDIYYEEDRKPAGFAVEMADLIIRVVDTCERYDIPLVQAIEQKMEYNKTRPYRHGNKLA